MESQLKLARPRFQKAYDPNDHFKWNSYVRGTIAYFEFDLPGLKHARAEVATVPEAAQNLKILDGMINCFYVPRTEAYSTKC